MMERDGGVSANNEAARNEPSPLLALTPRGFLVIEGAAYYLRKRWFGRKKLAIVREGGFLTPCLATKVAVLRERVDRSTIRSALDASPSSSIPVYELHPPVGSRPVEGMSRIALRASTLLFAIGVLYASVVLLTTGDYLDLTKSKNGFHVAENIRSNGRNLGKWFKARDTFTTSDDAKIFIEAMRGTK